MIPDILDNGIIINYIPNDLDTLVNLVKENKALGYTSFRLSGPGMIFYKNEIHVELNNLTNSYINDIQLELFNNSNNIEIETMNEIKEDPLFSIDSINNMSINESLHISFDQNDNIIIKGWAVDKIAKDEAGGVYIEIDGKLYPAIYGIDRNDVANYFQVSSYRYCGFIASIPITNIGEGKHICSLKVISKDLKSYYNSIQKIEFEIN